MLALIQIRAFSGVTTKRQSPESLLSHAKIIFIQPQFVSFIYAGLQNLGSRATHCSLVRFRVNAIHSAPFYMSPAVVWATQLFHAKRRQRYKIPSLFSSFSYWKPACISAPSIAELNPQPLEAVPRLLTSDKLAAEAGAWGGAGACVRACVRACG